MGSIIMQLLLVITAVAATITAMPTWHDQEVEKFLARLYASLDQHDFEKHDGNGFKTSTDLEQPAQILKTILRERFQNQGQNEINTYDPVPQRNDLEKEKFSRNLDSLGGGNIVRNLDSLGGGNIVRNLDQLGGGHIVRNVESPNGENIERNLDSLGGGNIVRNLDSLGGGNIVRNLDSLGGGNIVRNLDSLGGGNIVRNIKRTNMGRFEYMGVPRYIVRNIEQQNRENNMAKYLKRMRVENIGTLDSLGGPNLV